MGPMDEERPRALILASLLIQVCPLLGITKVALGLTELSQVEGSNLLGFLNLLLVGPDPTLQLVNQILHALMVLAILVSSKCELLDAALRFAQVLLRISKAAVFSIQLGGQLPDPSLHLVHGLLASLQGIGLCLIQAGLHILDLAFEELLVLLIRLGNLLFLAELISKASSIYHCILGLLIHLAMQSLHLRLELPLGSSNGLVLASQVRELLVGVSQFLLSLAPCPVSLFQKGLGLLKSILHGVGLPVSSNESITSNVLCSLLIFQLGLGPTDRLVVLLDGPLALSIGSIGMFQRSFQLTNISFKLLLHP